MAINSGDIFDPIVDKITEREMVYDIYERSTAGKPVTDNINGVIYFSEGSSLKKIDTQTIKGLPSYVANNIDGLMVTEINITAGSISNTATVYFTDIEKFDIMAPRNTNYTILGAYLERVNVDVKSLINIGATNDRLLFTLHCDVPSLEDDTVKIYFVKKED